MLGQIRLSAENVATAVEATSGADVMHAHGPMAVRALHQMRQVQVLMGPVRADA